MRKKVLFICTHNSARSQMAEGLLRHLAADKYEVSSAGTDPKDVNPLAIKAMAEMAIDISKCRSKSIKEFFGKKFDVVITVCDRAKEACPVFPGSNFMLHWTFPDPAAYDGAYEEKLKIFRSVRDEILSKVKRFIMQEEGSDF